MTNSPTKGQVKAIVRKWTITAYQQYPYSERELPRFVVDDFNKRLEKCALECLNSRPAEGRSPKLTELENHCAGCGDYMGQEYDPDRQCKCTLPSAPSKEKI